MRKTAMADSALDGGGPSGPRRPITYANCPFGLTATPVGSKTPTSNGEPATGVSAPLWESTSKTDTLGAKPLGSRLVTSRRPPFGVKARPVGRLPPVGVAPSSVNAPPTPTEYRVTVSSFRVVTYAKRASGENVTPVGSLPLSNGEPATGVRPPVWAAPKEATSLVPAFVTTTVR